MISGRLVFFSAFAGFLLISLWLLVSIVAFIVGDKDNPLAELPDAPISEYDRGAFGGWVDSDGNCLDTRAELLIAQSLTPAVLDETVCRVVGGVWSDRYTGETLTDIGSIDIDHLVPLRFAWNLGAGHWNAATARAFYNDQANLVITSASVNRSKGSKPPMEWLPPALEYQCIYIQQFGAILARYDLMLPPEEAAQMKSMETVVCN